MTGFENVNGKKTIYNRLKEITGIEVASKSGRTAYSTILGVPKSDPQLYRVVGGLLENRPDLLSQVYQVLGITQRRMFTPGLDYRQMVAQASSEARARTAELYTDVQNMPIVTGAGVGDVEPEDTDGGLTSEERAAADEQET